jgi:hypothetical protein
MGLFTDLFSSIVPKKRSGMPEILYFMGDSAYEVDIAGEENYQAALESLCGPRLPQGVYQFETARLVVNDKTGSNKNSVRVEIRGRLVGHLSLEDTIRYRRYLNAKGLPNAYGQCQAVIKGGWVSSDGRHGPFYVALDLPTLAL